jgi:hypothetical protein
MRWLMIGLLVSVGALVLASAGTAWHVWRQHRRPGPAQPDGDRSAPRIAAESDVETEETS